MKGLRHSRYMNAANPSSMSDTDYDPQSTTGCGPSLPTPMRRIHKKVRKLWKPLQLLCSSNLSPNVKNHLLLENISEQRLSDFDDAKNHALCHFRDSLTETESIFYKRRPVFDPQGTRFNSQYHIVF